MGTHPWNAYAQPTVQPSRATHRAANSENDLEIFTPGRWEGKPLPTREWIVDGLMPAGQVVMMSGDGGLGKSLLLQQLMTAAAIGAKWLSWDTKRVRSWGLFCEDNRDELWRRQHWINKHYGIRHSDIDEDVAMASRVDQTNYLCSFEKFCDEPRATTLYDQIMRSVESCGAQIIGIDTARRTFGGNELRDRQIAGYVRLLRKIAIRMQGVVVITAHPSNEGVASGSGLAGNRAWRNEVRSMIYLTDDKKNGEDRRCLHTKKNNYGKPGGKQELLWNQGVFKLYQEIAPEANSWYEPERDLLSDWPGNGDQSDAEHVHQR